MQKEYFYPLLFKIKRNSSNVRIVSVMWQNSEQMLNIMDGFYKHSLDDEAHDKSNYSNNF